MKLDRKGIPAPILRGESRKYYSVYTTYKSILIKEVMTRVNEAFWIKAKGGTDDLGNAWKDLAPSTHAYKPMSPIELGTYEIDKELTRGLLTPEQDKRWKTIFARTLQRLEKKGVSNKEAKKQAGERAWAVVKASGARTKIGLGRITDINIRYGRLVAATKPGTVSNNRYYPPKNQEVIYQPRGKVRIKFNLPYARAVDAVRPIVPNDISPWIIESHEIAIMQAKVVYDRIQSVTPDRKRRNSSKTSSKSKRQKRGEDPTGR